MEKLSNTRIKSNCILLAVSAICCLLLIEIYLRAFPPKEYEYNNPYKYTKHEGEYLKEYKEIYPLQYDRRGYYALSNGVIQYLVDKDRGRYDPSDIDAGAKNNVIVLGDSFAYGFGLRYKDTFPYLTQSYLKQNGINCKFMNFGEPAANTERCLEIYKKIFEHQPHKIVIYALHLNDLIKFPTSMIIKNPEYKGNSKLYRISHLYRFIVNKIETARSRKKNIQYILNKANTAERLFKDNLEAIRQIKISADKAKAQFIVVILPVFIDLENYPFRAVHDYISGLLKDSGVRSFDIAYAFKNIPAKNLWILPFDQHPNEKATKIIAEELARKLISEYKSYFEN